MGACATFTPNHLRPANQVGDDEPVPYNVRGLEGYYNPGQTYTSEFVVTMIIMLVVRMADQ